MTIKTKNLLKDRFWIIENNGKPVGTVTKDEERYMFADSAQTKFFNNSLQLENFLGVNLDRTEVTFVDKKSYDVYGYPTSVEPFNIVYDIKRKLPLFTKSEKSKSLYCAGYYIIRFEKGWVKSFCPKLITVERYETRGPFKTKERMKEELNYAV
jgi:hypothetical protein